MSIQLLCASYIKSCRVVYVQSALLKQPAESSRFIRWLVKHWEAQQMYGFFFYFKFKCIFHNWWLGIGEGNSMQTCYFSHSLVIILCPLILLYYSSNLALLGAEVASQVVAQACIWGILCWFLSLALEKAQTGHVHRLTSSWGYLLKGTFCWWSHHHGYSNHAPARTDDTAAQLN